MKEKAGKGTCWWFSWLTERSSSHGDPFFLLAPLVAVLVACKKKTEKVYETFPGYETTWPDLSYTPPSLFTIFTASKAIVLHVL